ncbi:hypothetical protein HAX54_046277 [Datura stramonium]|uniref:U-box domain-containing protein n=1 Tax=Datura stramonium TaxID=4076 RepID=A0ABS8WIN4_DATST|nr:hypothetical protein [Datura stramonium]
MVSLEDSQSLAHSHSHNSVSSNAHFGQTRPLHTPPPSSIKINRSMGRSMRTIRSTIFRTDCLFLNIPARFPRTRTDSVIDLRLGELAKKPPVSKASSSEEDFLELSQAFSDFSACSSDISGELQRLANVPPSDPVMTQNPNAQPEPEPCFGFLEREKFSTEIIESISPEDLQPTVKLCVDSLQSSSVAVKRSAAAKLRLLAKNRADNRALIGESGAIPALIPLLRCTDPWTQEHAVTALLNLSLHEPNKPLITNAGAIKSLIYVLKTGPTSPKQNAGNGLAEKAMVVLSLLAGFDLGKEAIVEEGGIAALVEVLKDGSDKGREFAVLTLLQLCMDSVRNRGLLVREKVEFPVALSQNGTAKAKHKAETLLGYLREPRQEASSSTP